MRKELLELYRKRLSVDYKKEDNDDITLKSSLLHQFENLKFMTLIGYNYRVPVKEDFDSELEDYSHKSRNSDRVTNTVNILETDVMLMECLFVFDYTVAGFEKHKCYKKTMEELDEVIHNYTNVDQEAISDFVESIYSDRSTAGQSTESLVYEMKILVPCENKDTGLYFIKNKNYYNSYVKIDEFRFKTDESALCMLHLSESSLIDHSLTITYRKDQYNLAKNLAETKSDLMKLFPNDFMDGLPISTKGEALIEAFERTPKPKEDKYDMNYVMSVPKEKLVQAVNVLFGDEEVPDSSYRKNHFVISKFMSILRLRFKKCGLFTISNRKRNFADIKKTKVHIATLVKIIKDQPDTVHYKNTTAILAGDQSFVHNVTKADKRHTVRTVGKEDPLGTSQSEKNIGVNGAVVPYYIREGE